VIFAWDQGETVFGAWERDDGPGFIEFSVEAVDEVTVPARAEQGFWATRPDIPCEGGAPPEELRDAASIVGSRSLDRHLLAREIDDSQFVGHKTWLGGQSRTSTESRVA
jgi:hypothetical protein